MSRVIRIDVEVLETLKDHARPGETPNAVIRRLLELPRAKNARPSQTLHRPQRPIRR